MPFLKTLASLKITVISLALLMVLVFWGTLYQVEYGLYAAQHRFYNSWFFFVLGVIPFPGAQLVLTTLFVNLLASLLIHFKYDRRHFGVIVIHAGILLLLGGGFVIHHYAQESFLTLLEGEGSNVSSSWDEWELSLWPKDNDRRQVMAVDADDLQPGQAVEFPDAGIHLTVLEYYPNCRAMVSRDPPGPEDAFSPSGIHFLEPAPQDKEPVQNSPGGIFQIHGPGVEDKKILLYGEETQPFHMHSGDRVFNLALRRKRFPLPMVVQLIDFRREMHPRTEVAKSFSSRIAVEIQGVTRNALIEMNEPLRHQGYTLYQASYSEREDGRESSTFAVVHNYGRLLPYVASILTFLGLLIHFLIAGFLRKENGTSPVFNSSPAGSAGDP